MEPALVDRINDVRAAHGLRRLRVSSLLTNAATRHANSMGAVGYFKSALHTPSSSVAWTPYGTWIDWYWPGAGYTSGAAGENRTWGAPDLSARAAVKRWMNSAPNRANLLTASWRRVGVAAVRVSDPLGYFGGRERVTIVVAEFGRRSDLADPVATSSPEDNLVREDMAFILYSSALFGYQTNLDKYGTCNIATAYAFNIQDLPCRPKTAYSAATHAPDAAWVWWFDLAHARANGYLLHNPDGTEQRCGTQYAPDVGDPAYQQYWISAARSYLAQYPWMTGLFVDGQHRSPGCGDGGYDYLLEYPTQQAWDDAQIEWASVVSQAMRAAGYHMTTNAEGWCPNCGDRFASFRYWWPRLAPNYDALNIEHFVTHPASGRLASTGTAWDQQWNEKQSLVAFTQSLGVDFYGIDHWPNTDSQGKSYTRVSFLLDWDGSGGGHYQTTCSYACATNNWVEGEPSTDVGLPVSPKVRIGVGWQREFTKATVLINPDPAVSQSFSVGGSTVTVAPVTARIIGK